ncbi:hypothetical protein Bca52824_088102 [Brassica carinata]|uniref:PNPLA domain-containing protein n=1 Tax=Brassica carinata TaxID=52824 RepID=A0A8X7TNW7_BRACI|nr:hypothetical protein Bca52824_088102 [Brassica carinata]
MQRVRNKPNGGRTTTASVKHLIKQRGGDTEAPVDDNNSLLTDMQEPSVDTDKLSYEIFSILESKFLFGYDQDPKPEPVSSVVDSVPGSVKNQRGKVCILSIDGGGMRGIIPGKALAYLEHALKSKSGDPNITLSSLFPATASDGFSREVAFVAVGSTAAFESSSPIVRSLPPQTLLTKGCMTNQ